MCTVQEGVGMVDFEQGRECKPGYLLALVLAVAKLMTEPTSL